MLARRGGTNPGRVERTFLDEICKMKHRETTLQMEEAAYGKAKVEKICKQFPFPVK